MDKELEQKLLREISKSGLPLELRVVEQLRNVAPLVFPNLSFTAENDKLHEIDALGFLDMEELEDRLEDKWPYGLVGLNLFVECKTSKSKPWVFFKDSTDPVTLVSGLADRLKCITDIEVKKPNLLLVGCKTLD